MSKIGALDEKLLTAINWNSTTYGRKPLEVNAAEYFS